MMFVTTFCLLWSSRRRCIPPVLLLAGLDDNDDDQGGDDETGDVEITPHHRICLGRGQEILGTLARLKGGVAGYTRVAVGASKSTRAPKKTSKIGSIASANCFSS